MPPPNSALGLEGDAVLLYTSSSAGGRTSTLQTLSPSARAQAHISRSGGIFRCYTLVPITRCFPPCLAFADSRVFFPTQQVARWKKKKKELIGIEWMAAYNGGQHCRVGEFTDDWRFYLVWVWALFPRDYISVAALCN